MTDLVFTLLAVLLLGLAAVACGWVAMIDFLDYRHLGRARWQALAAAALALVCLLTAFGLLLT